MKRGEGEGLALLGIIPPHLSGLPLNILLIICKIEGPITSITQPDLLTNTFTINIFNPSPPHIQCTYIPLWDGIIFFGGEEGV